ncbi:hypothetical protein MKK64_20865 [Methylobacterium sp. E-025]|uniref:hypothetical protein n=1 Tax=Methylobacterium sp. E-025 TaxID=2836561 RepID=UPI001FB92A38|nr:hypothetical protein [Methylobacterium sp. E-025]MCJ2113622.1 hypothetical protein [Methylobacterium sp. E-025]
MSKLTPISLVGLLSGAILTPAAAGEPGAFNGTWAVDLVTESGLCDARYSTSVAIRDGQVRAASAATAARVSGQVGADGTVGLSVSNGAASGAASGRLQAQGGAGTWKVSALCSGRWTARRNTTRTAQAE